jgi:hypothetical protein
MALTRDSCVERGEELRHPEPNSAPGNAAAARKRVL